ncbi:alpha/beta hydrolase family protein [Mycobacterium sp. LTG2003]
MRLGEILLCVANIVGLVAVAIPWPNRAQRVRHLAAVAPLAAIGQLIVEGYRWQMVAAYVLTAAIAVGWALQMKACTPRHTWPRFAGLGLGVVVFVVSVTVPVLLPVFRLPAPGGPFAIGTVTYHWRDDSRREIFADDPHARRELMAQIWYPAEKSPSPRRAPYVDDASSLSPAIARLLSVPEFIFGHFGVVPTHGTELAPVASARERYPVLVYLSGLNAFRQSNMFQIEQLVSHGFVVVGLDQPYTSAMTVLPDGRAVEGWSKDRLVDAIQQSITPTPETPEINGVALPAGLFPYLAEDVGFVLDQLRRLDSADPHGLLTGRLDYERAGAFGVSLGAITVGSACHSDPRLHACLMMDAAMPADVVRDGLSQPTMWLTRDADSILLERSRSGGWPDHEIDETLRTQRETFDKAPAGAGYYVEIPGMFHMNYTDAPSWTPLAERLALSGPIGSQRGHEIVAAYTVAFFNRFLNGGEPGLLNRPPPWPDVRIDRR